MLGRASKLANLRSVTQTCCAALRLNHLAPALQGCCAAGLLVCRGAGLLCYSSVAMQTGSPTILCWPRSRSKHYTEQYQATLKYLWHFARHKTTKNILITVFLVACDSHREHRKTGWRHMIVERRCSKLGFKKRPVNGVHPWKK